MKLSMLIEPSRRLERWAPDSPFRDVIAVRSRASSDRLLQAFEDVTLDEMPIARFLGRLRYLPALLAGGDAARRARTDGHRPFLEELVRDSHNLVLERTRDELVVGMIGKLHQIRDQEPVPLLTPADFAEFRTRGYEKLVMSVRAVRVVAGNLLVLEHRTIALDPASERRFSLYWKVIRPLGALVTRQLLEAVVRRAERPSEAARLRVRRRLSLSPT